MRPLLTLLASAAVSAATPSVSSFNVRWLTPTLEPGRTQGGLDSHQGGMPLGNGRLTAYVWANVSAGGFGLYLSHTAGLSSHTEIFKLAEVQVSVSPNPFTAGSYFNHTLDLASATSLLYAGGSSAADYAVLFSATVDANSDALLLDVASRDGSPLTLTATVASVRPPTVWSYTPPFATCAPITAQPDVLVDPLPPTAPLRAAPPLRAADAFRHASGAERPLRALFAAGGRWAGGAAAAAAPRSASFQPGSVIIYHRNADSDGLTVNMTLSQQGLPQLVATTPDFWRDNQFGFVLDGGAGPALRRASPSTLVSAAPAAAFSLRALALAVQTDTAADWLADLAALRAAADEGGAGAAAARAASADWWAAFWARSYIYVNSSGFPAGAAAAAAAPEAAAPPAPPLPAPLLWLRAAALAGAANGSAVAAWPDAGSGGAALAQADASRQPRFIVDGLGAGQPAVRFDGAAAYLDDAASALPARSTMFAVLRDDGSSGGSPQQCCSGVLVWDGAGNNGISTVPSDGAAADDDGRAPPGAPPVVAMLDFSGSGNDGRTNIRGRAALITAVHGAAASSLAVDGCAELSVPQAGAAGAHLWVGSRLAQYGRFFRGDIGEILVYPRELNASEIATVEAYLLAAWPAVRPPPHCRGAADYGFLLGQKYAVTRYLHAVQSRGARNPIKFNGMAFTAAVNKGGGEPDRRDWGPSNWWQNERLPYGAMLPAGDVDIFLPLLENWLNIAVFLEQRTLAYWNHTGIWTTETHHLTGAYDSSDYGCDGRAGWPTWLMKSGYLHVDQGGDSGTGEWSLMALDLLLWTGNATLAAPYLRLAFGAADYFMNHFLANNRSADGRIVVYPAQVLETWWCDWDVPSQSFTNCPADDSPTISGALGLFEKLLALPPALTTPAQRAAWAAFVPQLPRLPLSADGAVIAPARVLVNGGHNNEGPELYAMHPHRLLTAGRAVARGDNISLGLRTYAASAFKNENSGWNYGVNAAALLGLADEAAAQLIERAQTPPAAGYRFLGLAPHMQDYDPSADHYANFARAHQEMLLQSGDDGFENTTVVLFPAWPCSWDVSFKLWAPLSTSIEVVYAGGKLLSLDVQPPARAAAIKWARCVVAAA